MWYYMVCLRAFNQWQCCTVGVLQKFKWEDATTIQKGTWGYQRNIDINGYYTTDELIDVLVTVVRFGLYVVKNICVNVAQKWLHSMVD